jgi:hypothetical protein
LVITGDLQVIIGGLNSKLQNELTA